MNFFERHRLKRAVRECRQMVRLALAMREDVAPPAAVDAAREADAKLRAAWSVREWPALEGACERAAEAAQALMPPRPGAKWRENIEVLVVALSLAMACKCYFIQPFKIPTGSMQPTLKGIIAHPQTGKTWSDRFPFSWVKIALFGEYYQEVRAQVPGRVGDIRRWRDQEALYVAGVPHPVRLTQKPGSPELDEEKSMTLHVRQGDFVEKGQLLASGRVVRGDQVLVNKVRYHFARPERGDIIVFDAEMIPERKRWGIPDGSFYIKRLAGLSGEDISIAGRRLVADGEPVTSPRAFERLSDDPAYNGGYVPLPGTLLPTAGSVLHVDEGTFLPLGDNTFSSQDGRFFGPVSEKALVGPAFFVYWPFGPHWGRVE
ncbi:MAG: signal peptidase I [Kiritimatiellae bacterium]|nr:signal peptidase I [Kiritimatiellia bacterium]